MSRVIRARPLLADAVLSLGLCVLVAGEALLGPVEAGARVPDALTAPLLTLPLTLRRRYPAAIAVAVVAAVKVQRLAGGSERNTIAPILPLSVAMYSLALHASRRRLLLATAVCAALLGFAVDGRAEDLLFVGILLAVPFALGLAVRTRQQRVEGLEEQARVAVVEERARIARELHDVVAHSVGVMTVQAAAARRVMDRRPERAGEALAAIEATGREALSEMQRMVGFLREADDAQPLAPQPSLRHIDALVEQLRTAGLAVGLAVEPAGLVLPPGVDLAAYRIVQEALANSLKHSQAGRAEVVIRRLPGELRVEVTDPGPRKDGARGGGHGLIGMRERAQLYGGELWAGAVPGGGFEVRARLPLAQ
jgi:signal transduction histidine kinase